MASGFIDGFVAGVTWNFALAVVIGLAGGFFLGKQLVNPLGG